MVYHHNILQWIGSCIHTVLSTFLIVPKVSTIAKTTNNTHYHQKNQSPSIVRPTIESRKQRGNVHSNDDKLIILVGAIYLPISFSEKRSVVHPNGAILKTLSVFLPPKKSNLKKKRWLQNIKTMLHSTTHILIRKVDPFPMTWFQQTLHQNLAGTHLSTTLSPSTIKNSLCCAAVMHEWFGSTSSTIPTGYFE